MATHALVSTRPKSADRCATSTCWQGGLLRRGLCNACYSAWLRVRNMPTRDLEQHLKRARRIETRYSGVWRSARRANLRRVS